MFYESTEKKFHSFIFPLQTLIIYVTIINNQKTSKVGEIMQTYKLTAFSPDGEKLIDEAFQAENDQHAKELGNNMLSEKDLQEVTHRCTSPRGKLILFHR